MTATKNTAKKTTKANTTEKNGRAKKDGLRKPQVRILECLKKSSKALTRGEISTKAPVDLAFLTSYIGAEDPTVMARLEKKRGFKSLVALGFVRREQHDVNDRDVVLHEITASGRKALEKAKAV